MPGLDGAGGLGVKGWCAVALAAALVAAPPRGAADPAPVQSLAQLHVPDYLGVWYQVALYPNAFQRQCVADTTATYRLRPEGGIEVLNRCRRADGSFDEARGLARPAGQFDGEFLKPARLEVSFLPAVLRWLPIGWGNYWVIQRADDGRYAVVSEPTREYLWVLSRAPALSPADETAIRSALVEQGFDLRRLQAHPHAPAAPR